MKYNLTETTLGSIKIRTIAFFLLNFLKVPKLLNKMSPPKERAENLNLILPWIEVNRLLLITTMVHKSRSTVDINK